MPSVTLGAFFTGPNHETFKIIDSLGQGAFGEVYRAVGETSGAVVAVKLLPVGALTDSKNRIALLNEIKTARYIKHPNVVQVIHVDDSPSSKIGPFLVMEYVSGGSLATLLRAGAQIPVGRAVEMMIDIAQGARAINEKLIHRDIKPDNILIEGTKLKIGDFGISKFVDESTRLRTFKGQQHVRYMAPEGWANEANTVKIDIYSAGLVFHQILSLKHPLLKYVNDPDNFLDWHKAHLYQGCPDVRVLRPDVSLSIAQMLSRMVSKRPTERPSWDAVLDVLSQPETISSTGNPDVTAAVQAAVARKQELQKAELEAWARQSERDELLGLYRYACTALLDQLKPVVEQFNREFQHGKITQQDRSFISFNIPMGESIQLIFFPPKRGIKIRNGEVIGGGWLGLRKGRSANLVLLKHGADDLYGRWMICEVKIMGVIQPESLIGQFGITRETVEPFGLKAEYFYDHIQHVNGALHIFNYFFIEDVVGYFSGLIHDALK